MCDVGDDSMNTRTINKCDVGDTELSNQSLILELLISFQYVFSHGIWVTGVVVVYDLVFLF